MALVGGALITAPARLLSQPSTESIPIVEERGSSDGILSTSMRVALTNNNIDGFTLNTRTFDGLIPGPTLRVRRGDTLKILFHNDMPPNPSGSPALNTLHNYNSFNFHTHGLHVDPTGNADNVFLEILPGESHQTEIRIPNDHPSGVFWYHPHKHGAILAQIKSGMAGALIIEGDLDDVPEIAAAKTRVLIIQHIRVNSDTGRIGEVSPGNGDLGENLVDDDLVLWLLNGRILPTISIRPGEIQRFQIVYAGLNIISTLTLDNHVFFQIAVDGITLYSPSISSGITLSPGNRIDVLVRGGAPGTYSLRFGGVTLATVNVTGTPTLMSFPVTLPQESRHRTISDEEITGSRTLTFERVPGPIFRFTIDDAPYDNRKIDYSIRLGDVEEWTLQNNSTSDHPFHIHTNPFEVVKISGRALAQKMWMDVVNVPANDSVTIRTRFQDFPGKFVLHCHSLYHGDLGMMKNVNVYDPNIIVPVLDLLLSD